MSLPLWSLIAGIFSLFPLRRLIYLQNSVQHLSSFCKTECKKMFLEPFSLLPVITRIIVSVPLGKAAQIFSYCTFS